MMSTICHRNFAHDSKQQREYDGKEFSFDLHVIKKKFRFSFFNELNEKRALFDTQSKTQSQTDLRKTYDKPRSRSKKKSIRTCDCSH